MGLSGGSGGGGGGGGLPSGLIEGAGQALGGLVKAGASLFGGRKRRREQRRAKKEFANLKQQYIDSDTSNLYMGQDNMYEDLTVNQQQAQFEAEQTNQQLANVMDSNNQAAGGSGIAAMAQALANQQSQNIARSAISIGQQEQANQLLERQDASRIQSEEITGAYGQRAAELEKTETLFGMAGERVAAANTARKDATDALVGGIGDIAGGSLKAGASLITGGVV